MSSADPTKLEERSGSNGVDGQPSAEQNASPPRKSNELEKASQQTSAFQAAVAAWRNIDLSTLQKSLDSTASEIVNGQRDSLVERKELASKTKEYRKLDEEAKKEEWKGLLKSYQTFIDHLTTSKKATETAFLSLYSTLSEAPDPYPLLEATIDSLVNFSEMQALSKDNSSLNATVNRLSSQINHLEAFLNVKNRELERKGQEREEEVKRVEEVYKGVLDEKTRNWEGKEKALSEKVEHQENLLKELKASYEVAQRMGGPGPQTAGGEEDLLAKQRTAELEILTRDLERTTSRLAEVEGRNEQLRLDLERAASSHDHSTPANEQSKMAEVEEDSLVMRLQEENAGLLRKVENAKNDLEHQKREWERKAKALERTLDGLQADKEALRAKVTKWGDYEDMRRELEILKSIEFSTGDDDDDDLDFSKTGTADGTSPAEPKENKKESLEQMLLARNKKLGSELTVLRVSHQDLTTRLQSLQETLDSTVSELTAAQSLNHKLEDDLLKFQQETQQSSALSVAGTYVSRYPQSSFGGNRRASPASSIISGAVGGSPQPTLEALRASEAGGSGILPMITAQRDRFKQRTQTLEEELSNSQSTISNLRQEIASLQKDNLQLYEKSRYISSYSRPGAAATSAYGLNSNPASNVHPSGSGLAIDRYRQAYESNLSPFEAFRGRESARAYQRMGVLERVIYSFTRVILANRTSRNLFAGYCVVLHLLVFCMLYWAGTVHVEKHLPGMAQEQLDGLAGVAGGVAGGGAGGGAEEAAQPGDWHQEGFDDRL